MSEGILLKFEGEATQGLWLNFVDSIYHALDHVSNLSQGDKDEKHHKKWIIISVHHAAECFLKVILKELDPDDLFINSNSRHRGEINWYPSLSSVIKELKGSHSNSLKKSELKLFDLLETLNSVRNQIIHREIPDDFEPSIAAWSILAMLKIASRRYGFSIEDRFEQSPSIELDVLHQIEYEKFDDYVNFADEVLHEEYPDAYKCFEQCPYCWALSVDGDQCLVCYKEFSKAICPRCNEVLLVDFDEDEPRICMNCNNTF